jgi:acyl-coenzyme A thioesterase PaaI-like protein
MSDPIDPPPFDRTVLPFGGPDSDVGGPDFGELLDAMRELQDRFIAASVPHDQTVRVAAEIRAIAAELAQYEVPEFQGPAMRRIDLPGRGSALNVPTMLVEQTDDTIRGTVTFRRFHQGGNRAAHGGIIPILFDDVLGRLVTLSSKATGVSRTAYLHVNYRAVVPVGKELTYDGEITSWEGRKTFATGRICDGDKVLADAELLFVVLRPGQP